MLHLLPKPSTHGRQDPWEGHAIDVLFTESGQSTRSGAPVFRHWMMAAALIAGGALLTKIFWG